jgi:recombination protein RecA
MAPRKAAAGAASPPPQGTVDPPKGSAKDSSKDRIARLLSGDVVKAIRKEYGANSVLRASDTGLHRRPRLPSGIFPIDHALGGGWPAGQIQSLWGHKSSGKTTVVLRSIGEALKLCAICWGRPGSTCQCGSKFRHPVAAFIDSEGTLDLDWGVRQGVPKDALIVSTPDSGEQAIDIADALLRSGDLDILAMDSLAFLVPEKEITESVKKETIGVQARLVGKSMRKFRMALNAAYNERRMPTIFLTNQIRMKIGVMFGNPETQPAGLAPGFTSMTEVRMGAQRYELEDKTKRPLYVDIGFKVEKNKSAVSKKQGEFRLILSDTETKKLGDVYDEGGMVEEAEGCGLVEQKGGSWLCLGEKFPTKSKIEQALLKQPEFKASFRAALLQVLAPLEEEPEPPPEDPESEAEQAT